MPSLPNPTPSNNGQDQTLSSMIIAAFNNYENTLTRYEKLLVDVVKVNTEINVALRTIPTVAKFEEETKKISEDYIEEIKSKKDETAEKIKKMSDNLNSVLIWLKLACAVVVLAGGIATGLNYYFGGSGTSSTLKSKVQAQIEQPTLVPHNQIFGKPHYDVMDKDGNLFAVPVPTIPEQQKIQQEQTKSPVSSGMHTGEIKQ